MTIIYTLEERLASLSKQHDEEMQLNTQKVFIRFCIQDVFCFFLNKEAEWFL